MLDAVNGDGVVLSLDVEDALDPQNPVAVPVEQHGQPQSESGPVDARVDGHDEGMHRLLMGAAGFANDGHRLLAIKAAPCRRALTRTRCPAQQTIDIEVIAMRIDKGSIRIDPAHALHKPGNRRLVGQVGLGQNDRIGDCPD